ncbi:protein vav isoform X1 [Anopheles darlingi]|uniref:protein vav isoform X1 n=1 Tax=Anopheles darlingi TaxID=43151 RepID=UPI0020FFFAA4|nr:protein vav isoform X1 [Anopheles darlingi]XP_049533458.1 protein vav isoform X1 [Anopheles darlingi]XP_049533459.1 protein vav isoform X1 [Anopheles darlingi]XP_049533460.1 protein vav isoform X1 [Anopheles darlingi]XP_049533461.1 protein vav isoform X1 [Anopheles darlingi]XP_049533462.1 protein vav isoform X1 [Anopheles darlingi]
MTTTSATPAASASCSTVVMADDLWRDCAAWLTRCEIIPKDHRANHADSDIKVLATILRDGVLLCNLVQFLDPTSFDRKDFNRKPQMAHFLCIQNIKLFLEACKTNFGLKETELFEPSMLYDLTNFHKVLLTLSKLSNSRKVQNTHNIIGFTPQSVQIERANQDDDIYNDLHASNFVMESQQDNDSKELVLINGLHPYDRKESYTRDHNHEILMNPECEEEKIYEDLCYVTFSSTLPQLATSSNNLEQRDFVIKELLDTEKNYLEALNALKLVFMKPLEKLLPKEDIRAIFPCIKELVEIHSKFLERLHEACSPGAKLKLSATFLEFREPFLIYGEYCSSMTSAVETLREACKKASLVEQTVAQSQKEHSDGRLQLRDILSVPMQRILKYHLLLDKLVQETLPTHDDFRGLERAKEAMVDVAQYSNEVKRDSEHLVVIQKVKESISDLNLPNGNNLEQYGRLLLDGDLNIKAHEDQKMKHRYAFVFEKIMILVKNSNTKIGEAQYTFREAHNLLDYRIEILNSRRTLGRDGRMKYSLLLARKTQATAFTLYMKTEEEREKWKRAFDTAMETLEPIGCKNTDHKFFIHTFSTPVICRHCSKFLKGKIHQGYRCKVCEIIVHKGCISSTGRCKQLQNIPPPVCDRMLSEFNWFVGTMNRDAATQRLECKKIGTYLLRVRPQGASNESETIYALSLKTDNKIIKHMKIYKKNETQTFLFYLSTRRYFKTIIELVSFYERNDLGENFAGLNQLLQWPFKEEIVIAIYDFAPKEQNQLPLRQGCQVIVIGKEGDSKGWWRGKTMEKVGFFPKEYVRASCTEGL